jgi:hypothetical protein
MSDHIISFLTGLKSRRDFIGENLANKKVSTSLEDVFSETLTAANLQDLTEDWKLLQNGEAGYFDQSGNKTFRKNLFKRYKDYVNLTGGFHKPDLRTDTEGVFPANCFIRHPNGPNGHIDFMIVLNHKMLFWEIKTGGGRSGKLNDRHIPAQFFVLMCSRSESLDCPYTFFKMSDIMTDEAYGFYETAMIRFDEMKRELKQLQGYDSPRVKDYLSRPGARLIVGWGRANDDWYEGEINELTASQREVKVIDMLRSI